METRFKMLTKSKPEGAKVLWAKAQEDVLARYHFYEYLAQRKQAPDKTEPKTQAATPPSNGSKAETLLATTRDGD